jgi:murein DD-endopeptidase MepM/ murein hydrolase activator NlpD
MRELSGEQRTERRGYPDRTANPEPNVARGWLWHGFAALGISALGLAVAAAIGLTTEAETTHDLSAVPETSTSVVATDEKPDKQSATKDPALAAFGRRESSGTEPSTRSAAVRAALVQEQAAQRDELLAKTADNISRAAEATSSDARQKDLKVADRASREAAARIAAENLRRAIAARVAAANKRQAAENQPNHAVANSSKSDHGNSDSGSSSGGGTSNSGESSRSAGDGGTGTGGGGSGAGGASPVPGAVIGAHFGEYGSWSRYHTGLDFRASYGTPIRAVKAGVVLYAGNSGDWAGNHVAVKHGDGMTTMSSHMSSMAVHAGETVQAGQIIGRVGQTGRAFGAHLHFELYPAGVKYGDVYEAINPQPWLKANGVATH